MRNLSVKIALITCLGAVIMLLNTACIEPPDLDKFFNDETVRDKLKRDRVTLIDNSGDNLKAGNAKITGLKVGKYYITEKWDLEEIEVEVEDEEEGEFIIELQSELHYKGIYYVGSEGCLVEDPEKIVMITEKEKEIKNNPSKPDEQFVKNGNTYKVFSSAALTGVMTLYETLPDIEESNNLIINPKIVPSADEKTAEGEEITVTGKSLPLSIHPEENGTYYLELPNGFKKEGNKLKIITAPVSEDAIKHAKDIEGNIIELYGEESTIDYLIIQTTFDEEIDDFVIESFNVLRVVIGEGGDDPPACDCEDGDECTCGDDCDCDNCDCDDCGGGTPGGCDCDGTCVCDDCDCDSCDCDNTGGGTPSECDCDGTCDCDPCDCDSCDCDNSGGGTPGGCDCDGTCVCDPCDCDSCDCDDCGSGTPGGCDCDGTCDCDPCDCDSCTCNP